MRIILYMSFRDPASGKEVRRSLGHRNRKLGIQHAQELSAKFVLGVAAPRTKGVRLRSDDAGLKVRMIRPPAKRQLGGPFAAH